MNTSQIKWTRRAATALLAAGLAAGAGGCSELHRVVDALLGMQSTVSASYTGTGLSGRTQTVGADLQGREARRGPLRMADLPKDSPKPGASSEIPPPGGPVEGKKRAPGTLIKDDSQRDGPPAVASDGRSIIRVPLAPPEGEFIPTECPPSEPLCRYQYSQLKLVGVMQVGEGFLKGMVEDPDGRGYFVAPGAQIGGATVTQITSRGMLIHVHKTHQDREVLLYRSGKDSEEF